MSERLGVHQAALASGFNTTRLYCAAARHEIPSTVAGGKLYFSPVDLTRWKQEETVRRAKRQAEKHEAARRVQELLAKRRAARKP